ncbi:MAG TPA: efflux RND transporter periplasmic adaptor subunit [Tepidisphaeraceae bacterium]|jgi:RND family efflux transporter MFP subunit
MKVVWNLLIVACLVSAAGVGGYMLGHLAPSTDSAGDSDDAVVPVPLVKTALIQQRRIERKIVAYGVVTAQNSDVAVLSLPFESRVKKVLVIPGQRLDSESPVIEIEPSPDTQLQMLQAKYAVQAAARDMQQTRQRYNTHLATNQDLLQAEQNLQIARLKLDSLDKQGAGGVQQLKAFGLVSKVDVQQGQVIPAGAPLVEVAAGGQVQVRLGIEPADVASIHLQDPVHLSLESSPAVDGKVQMISQRINPDTRLIDLIISLPSGSALPLESSVRGELTLAAADGLIVPRSAVLPDDEGYSLFTVDHDKATKHKVTLGIQNDDSVQITSDGLSAGQPVVIVGNLELEDGMSVKTDASATTGEGSSTQTSPATQEAAQ